MTYRPKVFATIMALLAAAVLAGCTTGTPQDGRYQTHGGGWDNFRG
jgi:outer membrane PBP1 activator LpoA protein